MSRHTHYASGGSRPSRGTTTASSPTIPRTRRRGVRLAEWAGRSPATVQRWPADPRGARPAELSRPQEADMRLIHED